ncbi:uncharacterized protein LOC143916951 [Arctopsyche grandis]|uniref:uncharacterized protein LOC143916951 n=1 Tax=Arctopsyche grandis TaxID=121162 RepID=UPI00406D708D
MYEAWAVRRPPLPAFFRRYRPVLRPRRHTCVGLGLELLRRLPVPPSAAFLVSCEESIDDIRYYLSDGTGPEAMADTVEKEHVLVAMPIEVEGRRGLTLCDPGYHVARVVTVMQDRCYPHTGWFTQTEDPHCKKEYNYSFNINNPDYVEWAERSTRGNNVKYQTSLIYVGRPFCNAIDVTERRNLVYNFRSLLARDQKGRLVAGIYFPVVLKDAAFTIFYEDKSGKQRIKYMFSMFHDLNSVPNIVLEQIVMCNSQMNYEDGELLSLIVKIAETMADTSFISQILSINNEICTLSADN